MAADLQLYLVRPGDRSFSSTPVGRFTIRGIESTGQTIGSMRCLSIEVEAHGAQQPLTVEDGKGKHPLSVSWLELGVSIATNTTPRRNVGRVHIDQAGMLPLVPGESSQATWNWELRPEDVETVEMARSNQASAPIFFGINVVGITKLVDNSGGIRDLVPVRSPDFSQYQVELSHWGRLLQQLGYGVPPGQSSLVGTSTRDHPSWSDAAKRLDNARSHLRNGEDYDALREALSAMEAIASPTYSAASWKALLTSLPDQKADGLAELFSGYATFCNKIGHHRGRADRDGSGDFAAMPLDHWEADIAVAVAQYLVTYASRLRSQGCAEVDCVGL